MHVVSADRRIVESSYENNASSVLLRPRRRGAERKLRVLGVYADGEHCTAER